MALSAVDGLCQLPLPGGPSGLLDLLGQDDDERVRTLERLFSGCSDEELAVLMNHVQEAVTRRRSAQVPR
jgi:hypothetical protein